VVLILPGLSIPTPAVYRKFDEMGIGDRDSIQTQPDWLQWADLSAGPLLLRLVNDLEAPAFVLCPQLADIRNESEQQLGQIVRMSGSGSSLFTLYDNAADAESAASRMQERGGIRALVTELVPERIEDDLGN
jgi:4-diphosphocytidyl-2-C-methyl-D-erythritol kinase